MQVIVPECKSLQGIDGITDTLLESSLHMTVQFLTNDLCWLTNVTMKQSFCWGFIATCCSKVPISNKNFDWIYLYLKFIHQLCIIYSTYCNKQKVRESDRILTMKDQISPNEDAQSYFKWVIQIQGCLLHWENKFRHREVNYDDVLHYANNLPQLIVLSKAVCAHSKVVTIETVDNMKIKLQESYEQLNQHLICYIPGEPEASWCTLLDVLLDFGITLPPDCVDSITQHVLLPGSDKAFAAEHLRPSSSGMFQPGLNVSLILSKTMTLDDLCDLERKLSAFLNPLSEYLTMLVYFKLHRSEIFSKYVQLYLKKRSACQVSVSPSTHISPFLSSPSLSLVDEARSENILKLSNLVAALSQTQTMLMKLMEGNATYREIIAEGILDLKSKNLDVVVEFKTLNGFFTYAKPKAVSESLVGIQSMFELFQYMMHIKVIHSVCEQYHLQGCCNDPTFLKLVELARQLESDHTSQNAVVLLQEVKKDLCLSSQPHPRSLELFESVRNSTIFYQFVRDKNFVGTKGHAHFQQQYQLITAQLQHEEYNEGVLNHLYAAFHVIEPFMDTSQSFRELMERVTALDTTSGLKQLETVNTNITLIRLWFNRAEVSMHRSTIHHNDFAQTHY